MIRMIEIAERVGKLGGNKCSTRMDYGGDDSEFTGEKKTEERKKLKLWKNRNIYFIIVLRSDFHSISFHRTH